MSNALSLSVAGSSVRNAVRGWCDAMFRAGPARPAPAAPAQCDRLEPRTLLSTTPGDPGYPAQWGLDAIDAAAAWDGGTGSAAVTVGHLDSGIDYTHEDLYLNIWINQAEIPRALRKKLIDTDNDAIISFYDLNEPSNAAYVHDVNANGYIDAGDLLNPWKANFKGGWEDGRNGRSFKGEKQVDDIIGWDFGDNDNDPMDVDGHGTHTAGTIGAIGDNGVGTAGVVWKTSLMALKIFPDDAQGASDESIAAAIRYAADSGVRITNNSYGASGPATDVLYNALLYADQKGMLMVYAAGNDGFDNDNDRFANYPSSYELSSIISVAASEHSGSLASWSNHGAASVDLAAPGDDIYSTTIGGGYATESGTSMAAPHVTGALALMLSQNSGLTASQLKSRLLGGANQNSTTVGSSVSGGVLDVANAIQGVSGILQPIVEVPVVPVYVFVPPFFFPYGYGVVMGSNFGPAGIPAR